MQCALAGIKYSFWDTEEMVDLIRWMRTYNASPAHTRKVKFYGFDMVLPARPLKVALRYLRKVDPEAAEGAEKSLAVVSNPMILDGPALPRQRREQLSNDSRMLVSRFDSHKQEYLTRSSEEEWTAARQHARLLAQYGELGSAPNAGAVRDHAMAENIAWILEHEGPDAKIAVWAHNTHVSPANTGSMGVDLKKMFGDRVVTFGLTFNQGSFRAQDPNIAPLTRAFTVGPAPAHSLESTLLAAGLPIAVFPLRRLPGNGDAATWFNAAQVTRDEGGYDELYDAFYTWKVPPARAYDAIVFVDRTEAVRQRGGYHSTQPKLPAPTNLDFENGTSGETPANWVYGDFLERLQNLGYHVTTSEDRPHSGKRSAEIARLPNEYYSEYASGLRQRVDAVPFRGKRIRLRAAVRTEVTGAGNQAHLWLRVAGRYNTPFFYDPMPDHPITSNEWRDYEIVADVSKYADVVEYGLVLIGEGRAWLDDVSLEVVPNVQ